jgi:secreted trypsin-like serine protease
MRGAWLLLLAAGCVEPGHGPGAATSEASQPIIGGMENPPGAYPATGAVTAGMRLRCTGTLIRPDVVLTAAHCLKPATFGYLGFTLDTDVSDGAQEVVKALVTHQHPDFDETNVIELGARNDIGVMILERPVPIEEAKLELVDLSVEPSTDATLAMCGYGRDVWASVTGGVKRIADVTVAGVEELEFATSDVGPQPCRGDSGAPLFDGPLEGHALIGIVSRAFGDTVMCDTGAIITRTAPYAAWIAEASEDRGTGCAGSLILPFAVPLRWRRRRPRRR